MKYNIQQSLEYSTLKETEGIREEIYLHLVHRLVDEIPTCELLKVFNCIRETRHTYDGPTTKARPYSVITVSINTPDNLHK